MADSGLLVVSRIERLPKPLVERLAAVTLGHLGDVMGISGIVEPSIRPIVPVPRRVAGPAVTVKTRSGDYLMVIQALKVAQPGDVLVVNNGGLSDHCIWGGILSARAIDCGVVAFVTDGCVRDIDEIRALKFPVFAAGLRAVAPTREGPGEVNVPITLGGTIVCPGDVVVADDEGVAIVPRQHAAAICAGAEAVKASDATMFREIAEGRWKDTYFGAADEVFRTKGGIVT
jgi:regulator of RNase E activity RraA